MKRFFIRNPVEWMLCVSLTLAMGCTSFTLTSKPPADLYDDGVKLGTTPYSFELVSGTHTFTLKKFGYVEKEVSVSSIGSRRVHVNLEWVGRTRIDSSPRGASIVRVANGEKLGITPCGMHLSRMERVRISLEGFEPIERDLIPNKKYTQELKPIPGFKYCRDISFSSTQGAVGIYDRVTDKMLGVTPCQLNLEAGSAIEYRLMEHKPQFELIGRNAARFIQIKLDPIIWVVISGLPDTQIYRAGGVEYVGEVPFRVEVDGDLLFEIKKAGYYDQTVAVSTDSPLLFWVKLKKIPYTTIITDPPAAEIYRVGGREKLGESPFTVESKNERVLEIKKLGFEPLVIGVGIGSPSEMNISLTPLSRTDSDAVAVGELDNPVVNSF